MVNKFFMKSKIIGVIILLIIIIAGALSVFYYQTRRDAVSRAYREKIISAVNARARGDFGSSIDKLLQAADQAPTTQFAAIDRFHAAIDLLTREQGDDRLRAVALLKVVANDSSLPLIQRANAMDTLLKIHLVSQDPDFMTAYVLNGPPFAVTADTEIEEALRKGYELSFQTYPHSLAAFEIGRSLWVTLRSKDIDDSKRQKLITELERWTQKGEELLPGTLKMDYGDSKLGYIYAVNGLARRALARFGDQNYELSGAAYLKSLIYFDRDLSPSSYDMQLSARLNYAGMIVEAHGKKGAKLATEIMAPILNSDGTYQGYPLKFFIVLLKRMAGSDKEHPSRKDIENLASFIPAFRDQLNRYGFNLTK